MDFFNLTRLSSISRAVWRADANLASTLLSSSELAAEHLVLISGIPRLIDPSKFEAAFAQAKRTHHEGLQQSLAALPEESANQRAKKQFRISKAHNKSLLYRVNAPKLVLDGIKSEPQNDFRPNPPDSDGRPPDLPRNRSVFEAIKSFWGPVFTGGSFNMFTATGFLIGYIAEISWQWGLSMPPSRSGLAEWLKVARPAATGYDQVSIRAWARTSELGLPILSDLLCIMCNTPPWAGSPSDPASLIDPRIRQSCPAISQERGIGPHSDRSNFRGNLQYLVTQSSAECSPKRT